MLIGGTENPFNPGAGELPPELAGRGEVTARFETELRRLESRRPASRIIVMNGPRGCGKTALLAWLATRAEAAGIDVVDLADDALRSADALAAELALPRRGVSGKVRLEGSVAPELGGFGGAIEAGAAASGDPGRKSVAHILRSRGASGPLILIVDEAHELEPAAARALFTGYQAAAKYEPMLLAVAGTPDTETHLNNARVTFRERARKFRIGRIADEEAYRALARPLEARGVGFDEEVLRRAAALAQNYPHFLQCWGEALWDAEAARIDGLPKSGLARFRMMRSSEERPHVGPAALEAATEAARALVEELYASKLNELLGYRLRAASVELALAVKEGQNLEVAADLLIEGLAARWRANGEPPPRGLPAGDLEASARQLLLHTGLVWEASPGEWEFGIPSLADHAVRTETLRVGRTIVGRSAAPVARALLADLGGMAGSRREFAAALLQSGAVDDAQTAAALLELMERPGIVGPTGAKAADGGPAIRLQTPLFLRLALDHAEKLEAAKAPPPPAGDGPSP